MGDLFAEEEHDGHEMLAGAGFCVTVRVVSVILMMLSRKATAGILLQLAVESTTEASACNEVSALTLSP